MLYLTDIKGGYTTESRSLLVILKKVFFKDNPNMALDVLNSMVHTERYHGIKFLVGTMKDLKSRVIAGQKYPRRSKSKLVVGLKNLDRVHALKLLSFCYRWKARKPNRKTYAKFCREIDQGRKFDKHDHVPNGYGFNESEIKRSHDFIETASIRFGPLESEGAHVMEDNVSKNGPQNTVDELYALTDAGQLFLDHAEYIGRVFDLNEEQLIDLMQLADEKGPSKVVGRISALTDDGALKLRHVANLKKGWQVLISPLVEFYKFIEEEFCPQSANWNQYEGAVKAACAANDHFNLSSFDVVSSTDNIPRDLFFMLMDPVVASLPKGKKGDLIRDAYAVDKTLCEKGIYLTPFEQPAWYDIGQAMGRWTSKSQLNLIMNRLIKSVGGSEHNSRINGDDVIVWEELVSIRFEDLLIALEIPINCQKSFIRLANGEFSGRVIFRDEGILPVFKGRVENSPDDPLGAIRQYGKDGLEIIQPPSFRSKVKRIARYLVGRDSDVEGFVKEMNKPAITTVDEHMVLRKEPVVEKQETPLGLINQLYVAEEHSLNVTRHALAQQFAGPFCSPGTPHFKKLVTEYHYLTERSRRLDLFKRAAVKRYRLPNNRLDTLVDNLNAKSVITSDGHEIPSYGTGDLSKLYKRLMVDVPNALAHNSKKPKSKKGSVSKKTYFNRLNRTIREWEAFMAQPPHKVKVKSTIGKRFAEFLFGRK